MQIGRTQVSAASLNALSAMNNSLILLAGDLSYADGYPKIWDAFGQLLQTLGSAVPVMSTGGNHEAASAEAFLSYKVRFPSPNAASGSPHISYYGYEVGPVHVIALCSYAGFSNTSMQYQWLQNYLATKIDRVRTPWLIALTHVPLYASNSGHYKEGETMRRSMEPLLVAAGVDLVITGHIHAYERISPVIDYNLDKCGTNHMVLGDAGNYEASYTPWLMNVTSKAAPTWSAFREASFGVAGLTIHNATHATYKWHRVACDKGFFVQNKNKDGSDVAYYSTNADPDGDQDFSDNCISANDNSIQNMLTVDSHVIIRPSKAQCPNKHAGLYRAAQPVVQIPTAAPSLIQPFSAASCFAGSDTLTLESGNLRALSDIQVGDRILAADASGKTLFSEVVYVPHGINMERTQFVHLSTENNDLKMTKNHILPGGSSTHICST
jgi:UDP-2,3-diacylglucosamine pyrophosphatase LpxH